MALPHLAPVHGVRDTAAYANLTNVQPLLKSAVARRAIAASEAQAEAALKRTVEKANAVLDRLEAREKSIAGQIKDLDRRKKATARRIERIEDRILTEMLDAQLATVEGLRCSFRAQTAAAALVVDDQSKIPAEFFRQPKTPPAEVDKVLLKAALAQDPDLDPANYGCKLLSKVSLVRR
jgi:hypothetical protein